MNRLKHDSQDAVNNAKRQNWTISLTIPDGSPAPHGATPGGGCRGVIRGDVEISEGGIPQGSFLALCDGGATFK